jgi:hypothetical protein
VSSPRLGGLAGTVRWAIVPFSPRPPFRLYAGEGHAPIPVSDPATLVASARQGGDSEFTYLVPGKARPVLVLSEPPSAHHQELTALRLLRLSKVGAAEQDRIRRQEDPLLFHLDPGRFDLPDESAAMVSALVRIHVGALHGEAFGALNPKELRVLGERIIGFYGFDTSLLVARKIQELAARRRRRDEER